MAEPNGQGPVPVLAGHLVIYEGGVVAFRSDGSEDVVHPPLPPMVVPMLVKLLRGEELSMGDIPGGALAKAKAVFGRG